MLGLHVRRTPVIFNSASHDASMIEQAHARDWWRGAVIYQIYPRSFQDNNGDGIGDLAGISQRLDYVADLGVDAIWLSPFFSSPMKDFGYDISNYREVDPIFGTLEDFDRLLEKAHALGLRVIIDQVISHTSDQHSWFQESRQSRVNARNDWYVWADPNPDGTAPNNWLSIFGGPAWSWDARRKQYFMHNFLSSQPDLNFHNRAVQDAVLTEMEFWLQRGVDGFRLDTVNFYFCSEGLESNPPVKPEDYNASIAPDVNPYNLQEHIYDKSRPENAKFMERIRALLDKYPGTTSVGEIGDAQRQAEIMAEYTSGDSRLHMAYTFDFLGGEFTAEHFRAAIQRAEDTSPDGWTCLAFSNHDVARHVSRWGDHAHANQVARLCAQLVLSLKGSVCLYQGEELGLSEAELAYEDLVDPYGKEFWPNFKGRDGCRTPMVWQSSSIHAAFSSASRTWLPIPADHMSKAVDLQEHKDGSTLTFYQQFISFRKSRPELISGSIELVDAASGVLAFYRAHNGQKLLCVFNMSASDVEFAFPDDVVPKAVGAPGGVAASDGSTLNLGPFEAYIGAVH